MHFCPENLAVRFEIVGAVGGAGDGDGAGSGAGAGIGCGAGVGSGAGAASGAGVDDGAVGVELVMLPHAATMSEVERVTVKIRALIRRFEVMSKCKCPVRVDCTSPAGSGAMEKRQGPLNLRRRLT